MRLVVGRLPPSVYWRRRGLVVMVVLACGAVVANCEGGRSPVRSASGPLAVAPQVPATGASSTVVESSSLGNVDPGSPTGTHPSTEGSASGGGEVASAPPAPPCADTDMAVTAVAAPLPGIYGGTFTFTVKVRNTAGRSCSRDVGSGPQELRVLRDGVLVWSSDDCGTPQDSDVRTFGPNIEAQFRSRWSSYRVRPDDCQPATVPAPVGTYQLVARLGTILSAPSTFVIVR